MAREPSTRHKRKRFSPKVYAGIIKDQGGICGCGCGEPLGDDPRLIEFDHERALWDEGEDVPDNLRAVIKSHHLMITRSQAKRRAKLNRLAERNGLMKRRLNQKDKALMKQLQKGSMP